MNLGFTYFNQVLGRKEKKNISENNTNKNHFEKKIKSIKITQLKLIKSTCAVQERKRLQSDKSNA